MARIATRILHSRRSFLHRSSLAVAGFWIARSSWARVSPNEKINIGMIGTANRAREDLRGVSSQNIAALCDVDDTFLASAKRRYPDAQTYNDFRKLLEQKDLDAVVVATPDHTHAVATVAALQSGRHVYCEKPLTHTVSEAPIVTETARQYQRVTQMGTQIHAGRNYRRVVEVIQSGAIGPVGEVHVWQGAVYTAGGRPKDRPPVPATLHWDLWLGPVPSRPYHPAYVPRSWRNWWAFGSGTLGDFGCHFMDLPFWALALRYPLSVETKGPPVLAEGTCPWLIARYEFPAREMRPSTADSSQAQSLLPSPISHLLSPVTLTWYHGVKNGHQVLPPLFVEGKMPAWGPDGVLFVGEKGMLLANYDKYVLLPEKEFAGYEPPPHSIPDSIGHHAEWIQAIKTGGPTTCNFDYSGALTEAVLLGNVAYRSGTKIEWDPHHLRAIGNPKAERFIQHQYRKGWSL